MGGYGERPQPKHASIGFRIHYAFERDESILHNDVNWRNGAGVLLFQRLLTIDGAIYIHAKCVVSPGGREDLNMIDYGFDTVQPSDGAFGIVFDILPGYLSRQDHRLALNFEIESVEDSMKRKRGESLMDCPLDIVKRSSGPLMLLRGGAERNQQRRASDPGNPLQ
jgi:hypothetical protein